MEKQSKFLQKVKVSGGGRCNVTNAISDPLKLAENYPRGGDFLKEPFKKFNTEHTKRWFRERGVSLKTESDGRVFPTTNSSQTIIDCFLQEAKGIDLMLHKRVESFYKNAGKWVVELTDGENLKADNLMVASGSDKRIWDSLFQLGLEVNRAVPSLFTFNIQDTYLRDLQGISFEDTEVSVVGTSLKESGALLITHWGLSGPTILRLSAWGAHLLAEKSYHFEIKVNWLANKTKENIEQDLKRLFLESPKKNITSIAPFGLSQRFWQFICGKSGITKFQKGAETGKKQIRKLIVNLTACTFKISGKSTFKEEFVTAGGVCLNQINPDNFATINLENLYFGGEVLDIDAITGGFNFQAAWTAGWLVSEDLHKK